ncbi:MAG: hypothetical protein KIT34_15375 [Cyanobacteria bacterium TGS_CYA1]|nr:hypothetical protein [Cyanobacteria bacterium TGS_CYA1]
MSKKKKVADTRLFGLDISHHQDVVDWSKVAAAGVKYAFLKASEGSSYKDSRYKFNRENCAANGIPCGAYHFFRPQVRDQVKQISTFVSMVGAMKVGELPPVLDLEVPESWRNLSLNQRVKITRQWLDGVESALGVKPIVYLSSSFAGDILGSQQWLQEYVLWLAHYTKAANPRTPEPWKSSSGWTFWQYSETGRVDGIKDNFVDLNRFNGDASDLKKLLWKSE